MVATARLRHLLVPLLVLLTLAALPGLAPAQSGHDEHPLFGKWRVTMDVTAATAYGPQRLISGTKVQVATNVVPQGNAKAGILPLETVSCKQMRLYVGGTKVDETNRDSGVTTGLTTGASAGGTATGSNGASTSGDPGLAARAVGAAGRSFLVRTPQGSPGGGPGANDWQNVTRDCDVVGIRFASTHFADGQAVPIKLETDWEHLVDSVVQSTTTLTTTLATKAHNKLQTLGTNVYSNSSPSPNDFVPASDRLTNAATVNLATHTANPGSVARSETRASILQKIKPSTVVAALTHGGNAYFNDSSSAATTGPNTISFSSDVAGQVAGKTEPRYNVVGFWACETLSSLASSPSYLAYDTTIVNTAYLGFREKTIVRLFDDEEEHGVEDILNADLDLGHHALAFWMMVAQGETIGDALDFANQELPPRVQNGLKLDISPMEIAGDRLTRLRYVYLSSGERSILSSQGKSFNVWYVKFP